MSERDRNKSEVVRLRRCGNDGCETRLRRADCDNWIVERQGIYVIVCSNECSREVVKKFENTRLINLLTDIRQALGDDGKRMQDEFVEYCKGIGAELERLRLADQLLDSLPEETEVTIRKRGGMWPSRIYMPDGDLQAYCHGSTPTEAIKEAVSAFHALDKQADNGGEG
jgi:hypothetical protein